MRGGRPCGRKPPPSTPGLSDQAAALRRNIGTNLNRVYRLLPYREEGNPPILRPTVDVRLEYSDTGDWAPRNCTVRNGPAVLVLPRHDIGLPGGWCPRSPANGARSHLRGQSIGPRNRTTSIASLQTTTSPTEIPPPILGRQPHEADAAGRLRTRATKAATRARTSGRPATCAGIRQGLVKSKLLHPGSRSDLLLKPERVVIESKMTRQGLGQRELVEQLIVDKAQYRRHPDCGTLVCFAYDPGRRLPNPAAIERDLSGNDGRLNTIVVVSSRGL